jgi:hypothetical protein
VLRADDDDEELRSSVDEQLRELLLDDALDLGVDSCVVEGTVTQRAHAVLQRLR